MKSATTATTAPTVEQTIDQLNVFLRGELSAVETYNQAITSLSKDPMESLNESLSSHQQRVTQLRSRIFLLGGIPAQGSGMWGTFVKLVEGTAATISKSLAIKALEQGEDQGLSDYRSGLTAMDEDTRLFVENEILPEQIRTHGIMSELKRTL